MPTTLSTSAVEESTYIITFAFTDSEGNAVTPNSGLKWTLTDADGNVVNGRNGVSITPGPSVNVVLQGDDLALEAGTSAVRVVTIEGTYDSSLGTNLPLKDQAKFTIEDLVAVS